MRALCFDFDGTLARFQGNFEELVEGFAFKLGLDAGNYATFTKALSTNLRQSGVSSLHTVVPETLLQLQLPVPNDLDALIKIARKSYKNQMALLPGSAKVLELVANVPKAIITNGPSDMQRDAIDALGIGSLFDTIIISGDPDVAVRKPDPRIFKLACERLRVLPQDVLMIGDNYKADISGASAVGMQTLYLGTTETSSASATTIEDAYDLLAKWIN